MSDPGKDTKNILAAAPLSAIERETKASHPPLNEAVFSADFAKQNPDQVNNISKHQLVYSLAGLVLGLFCVLSGVLLFMNGVAGSSAMTAKILGTETTLSDAAPGAILFVVGLLIVFLTRYVLKVTK